MAEYPHFDWSSANLTESFRLFKQQVLLMFDVKDIKVEKQVSHILLLIGQEGLKRFNSWGLSGDDAKNPAIIWQKFEEQLDPPENFRIARLILQKFKQSENETIDEFINKCKLQAQKCEFKDANEVDDRIIDQLIYGVRYEDLQKEYLSKDKTLTLSDAIKLGRTFEASIAHMRKLTAVHSQKDKENVHYFKKSRHSSQSACTRCGRSHPKQKEKCPAYGSTCGACGKQNHWAKFCMFKDRHKQNGKQIQKKGKLESQDRDRSKVCHSKSNIKKKSKINAAEQVEIQSESSESDTENFEPLRFSVITGKDEIGEEVITEIDIRVPESNCKAKLTVKVDTGATGNTIPLRIFKAMCPGKVDENGFPKSGTLRKSNVRLLAYNGTNIEQYGVITIPCAYGKKSKYQNMDFYVVKTKGPAILGLVSSVSLKLVSIHCSVIKGQRQNASTRPIESIDDLMKIYPDQFDRIGNFPGEYHICTDPNILPIVHAQRKTPIPLKDEIKKSLEEMEALNVIRRVREPTDWVSSLTYIRKSNGELRICLDPTDLNRAILRCHHKAPTLEEVTHLFNGATVFSKLDAKNGYWSVKLDNESQLLTTFNSPYGRYCFCRMPFGLVMSQDVFQSRMDMILEKVNEGVLGIADDVAVFAEDEKKHDITLHKLMKVATEHGLVFNSSKCQIKVKSIKFFGVVFDVNGSHPDPVKVDDLKCMDIPTNKTSLQEFLGLATYMSPFIPNLSDMNSPLRELLKKNVEFEWSESHQRAYDKVKDAICNEVTLSYYDRNKASVVQVDASTKGLGAALTQDGEPIMFASKSLSDTETRYVNIERELLAAVWAVERFHTFLYGKEFIIESDHKPLEMISLKNLSAAPPRLQRMLQRLQGYDCSIRYRPGREMVLADCLSRQPNKSKCDTIDLDVKVCHIQFSSEKLSQLRAETLKDETLCNLRDIIVDGWPEERNSVPMSLRPYWSFRDELGVENGLILKGERLLIPASMQNEILDKIHTGHQGIIKCQLRAKTCVYWVNINKDIEETVGKCSVCQMYQRTQPMETLKPHEIPTRPWQIVGTDLFHFNQHEYLIVADYYSKFPVVRYVQGSCTASAIVNLTKQIFSEYGCPEKVISDNGPQYSSMEYKKFLQTWQIVHTTSSPRYPRSNGFIERNIQTVKNILKKAKEAGEDPELAILCARTTPIDAHLPSPAELMFNRKIVGNLPIKIKNCEFSKYSSDKVKEQLENRQTQQKEYHDRQGVKDLPPLVPGQTIRFQDYNSGKWAPAKVIEKCPQPRSYLIETPEGSTFRRNRTHLKETPITNSNNSNNVVQSCNDDALTEHAEPSVQYEPKNAQSCPLPYVTRSGREIKKPQKIDL